MEYLSVKELSIKWNITTRRITTLASQGKIPGAIKVANNWLIPIDANKPLDERYSSNKNLNNEQYKFKFPLYCFALSQNEQQSDELSKEEKRLIKNENIFHSNNMELSYPGFLRLYKTTTNPFIKIASLYYLSFTDMLRQRFDDFEHYYNELKEQVEIYKKSYPSLEYILLDAQLITKGNVAFDIFTNTNNKTYDKSSFSYIASLEFYKNIMKLLSNNGNVDLTIYECICDNYENAGYYYVAQQMHLLLAIMYAVLHNDIKTCKHVKKGIDIGIEHNIYSTISEYHTYLIESMEIVLSKYPPHIKHKIEEGNELYLKAVNAVAKHYVGNKAKILKLSDYKYLIYAVNDVPNKVIALNLKISESRISEKYSQLCEKFNVSNKKELAEKLKGYTPNPYLIIAKK